MKRFTLLQVATISAVALASAGSVFGAPAYATFGDAEIVTPGNNSPRAAQIRSDCSDLTPYGGVGFEVPSGLVLADLDTLSTDFQFTAGSCGGGSPRFQINVVDPDTGNEGNVFVYLGAPPNYTGCPQNVWLDSGNLLGADSLVDASQIGGVFYQDYSDLQDSHGDYVVTGIQVVADGCWLGGTQTAQVDNVTINEDVFTFDEPLSAEACKKGGWMTFARSNGTLFKNQGDCIQYVNTGK